MHGDAHRGGSHRTLALWGTMVDSGRAIYSTIYSMHVQSVAKSIANQ